MRVFITGSADGLGQSAARRLIARGHEVVLHARHDARAQEALAAAPGALSAVIGDLSSIEETKNVAEQVNALGVVDAVIHNAALGYRAPSRVETVDGLSHYFAVNSLAPYVLTALIAKPERLVFLSSGMHREGDPSLHDLQWSSRKWNGPQAYSDSKLHDVLLAFALARRWPDVLSNAVDPGWVSTKMGGPEAPGDLEAGSETQAWLAVSDDHAALVSGEYFHHKRVGAVLPAARDMEVQDAFIAACEKLSGIELPA